MIICLFGFRDLNHYGKNNATSINDTILWSSKYRLVWDDFKGLPDNPKAYVKALTMSGIYVRGIRAVGKIPKYNISSYFIKSASWTKAIDENNLKHEQLHFDISELYARKLRKSYDSLNSLRVIDRNPYRKVFDLNIINWDNYQDLYDSEVYFNEVKQREWINKVASELENLKKYQLKE